MRVLITGATGLIGKKLVKGCLDKKIEVHFLTIESDNLGKLPGAKGFLWNAKEQYIDVACLKNVDSIIHLAGANIAERWTDEHKKAIYESRVNTAELLLHTLKDNDHQVKQFISASAIGAYPSSLTKEYNEEYPDYNSGFLGKVVEVWEAMADQFQNLGLLVTKVRVGVVLAKDGGALPPLVKPIKNYVGAPLGSGEQWQSWVHIDDLVGIFVYCVEHRLAGIYNAVAPHPVTNATMTKIAAAVLDKPLWMPKVPATMLRLIMGEMAAVVLESQKVSSDKIEKAEYDFTYERLDTALENLLD